MTNEKNPISKPVISNPILFGAAILGILLFIFIIWATTAPLESAAAAPGKIIVAGNRKTIQHLEGGIIREIHVREGTPVKAGQLLITLDDTQARANYQLYRTQVEDLGADVARLKAERDNRNTIEFPPELLKDKNNPNVQAKIQSQLHVFANNRQTLQGQLQIFAERIKQLTNEIQSLQAQVQSEDQQLRLINEEIKSVRYLEQKKLIERPRLLALEREAARLAGNRGEHLALIARAQQRIGETNQQILSLKDTYLKDVLKELGETEAKLSAAIERKKSAEDILKRTLIKSPQTGIVVGLQEHTVGGVITAGKPIMDIVPSQGELIVEAQVSPNDIDVVHPGLNAKVQLTPYKQRRTPWVEGKVTYVSADTFQDQKTGTSYYIVYVNIPPKKIEQIKGVALYPGMPVQVMIIVDRRTFFSYMMGPLLDSFYHAFREQ